MLAVGLDLIEAVSCYSCARCGSLHSSYMSGQKFDQIPTGQAQKSSSEHMLFKMSDSGCFFSLL